MAASFTCRCIPRGVFRLSASKLRKVSVSGVLKAVSRSQLDANVSTKRFYKSAAAVSFFKASSSQFNSTYNKNFVTDTQMRTSNLLCLDLISCIPGITTGAGAALETSEVEDDDEVCPLLKTHTGLG